MIISINFQRVVPPPLVCYYFRTAPHMIFDERNHCCCIPMHTSRFWSNQERNNKKVPATTFLPSNHPEVTQRPPSFVFFSTNVFSPPQQTCADHRASCHCFSLQHQFLQLPHKKYVSRPKTIEAAKFPVAWKPVFTNRITLQVSRWDWPKKVPLRFAARNHS